MITLPPTPSVFVMVFPTFVAASCPTLHSIQYGDRCAAAMAGFAIPCEPPLCPPLPSTPPIPHGMTPEVWKAACACEARRRARASRVVDHFLTTQ